MKNPWCFFLSLFSELWGLLASGLWSLDSSVTTGEIKKGVYIGNRHTRGRYKNRSSVVLSTVIWLIHLNLFMLIPLLSPAEPNHLVFAIEVVVEVGLGSGVLAVIRLWSLENLENLDNCCTWVKRLGGHGGQVRGEIVLWRHCWSYILATVVIMQSS